MTRQEIAAVLIDELGRRVGPGEIGRIARGGHVPLGYYKDPVKTAAMFVEVDGERPSSRVRPEVLRLEL